MHDVIHVISSLALFGQYEYSLIDTGTRWHHSSASTHCAGHGNSGCHQHQMSSYCQEIYTCPLSSTGKPETLRFRALSWTEESTVLSTSLVRAVRPSILDCVTVALRGRLSAMRQFP